MPGSWGKACEVAPAVVSYVPTTSATMPQDSKRAKLNCIKFLLSNARMRGDHDKQMCSWVSYGSLHGFKARSTTFATMHAVAA
jgi:hypothetical protein